MDFLQKLDKAIAKNNSLVCVGLDPDKSKIPHKFKDSDDELFEFNKSIIDATADQVCAFKPNPAFYEAYGAEGVKSLEKTCKYILENYSDIPIIYDCKRGDIGNTNKAYAISAFDQLGADAVTLHPYFGKESLKPFLEYKDKGIIIMIKSSNEGSDEFQNLQLGDRRLFEYISEKVVNDWNENNNCLLMIGATYPEDMSAARKIAGNDITFLVPGVGAQQGDIEKMLSAGLNDEGMGLIINSSRSVIFSDDPKETAVNLRILINKFRKS